MAHIKAQLLNSLKRASYGVSKLVLLWTSSPCTVTIRRNPITTANRHFKSGTKVIPNRLEAPYICHDFLKGKKCIFHFNVKLMCTFAWVVGHGGSEFLRVFWRYFFLKKKRFCASRPEAAGEVYFYLLAFVDLKRALKNSDSGKCRGIIVQSTTARSVRFLQK
jgi:hypothetical protein